MSRRVLIVEDDRVALGLLAEVLGAEGYDVRTAASAEAALADAREAPPQVVVTDVRMAAMDGLALLRALRQANPRVQVIVVTAFGSLETAVEAIRAGAFDYLSKPFGMDDMRRAVARAFEVAGSEAVAPRASTAQDVGLLGRSAPMTEVFKAIARVAPLRSTVLIQGETGTGKELAARAIHDAGPRAAGPYVTINCPSLPEGLLESELFGHVKGAFTGAAAAHGGLFRAAHGGTLLLDEIGDMPLSVQAKLLRVLETGEVRSVGATAAGAVDVRVLAATHRDLERATDDGRFRQDLLYRLNTMTIRMPPLRDRLDDLPLLAEDFLARHARAMGRGRVSLTPAALGALAGYAWPGNVRELSHVLERAVALAQGPRVDLSDLPPQLRAFGGGAAAPSSRKLEDVERAHIESILKSVGGARSRAAAILGIDRKTLYRRLLRYGFVEREDEKEASA